MSTTQASSRSGTPDPRVRPVAAPRQEPDAADRAAARRRHPAAARPARPARWDQDAGDRPVLRGDERGRRCVVLQPPAAARHRRGRGFRPGEQRLGRPGRGRRVPVTEAAFMSLSPVVTAGLLDRAAEQALVNSASSIGILGSDRRESSTTGSRPSSCLRIPGSSAAAGSCPSSSRWRACHRLRPEYFYPIFKRV